LNNLSEADKERLTGISIVAIICSTVILTVTGSVSIWTNYQYDVAKLALQLALRVGK
jgi:hypothetical protein